MARRRRASRSPFDSPAFYLAAGLAVYYFVLRPKPQAAPNPATALPPPPPQGFADNLYL